MKVKHLSIVAALSLSMGSIVFAQNCALSTATDASLKSKELSEQVSASKACSVVPGITPKKLSAVLLAMLSSPRTGGQRFESLPPTGVPTGKILPSSRGIEFDLQSVMADGVAKLDVMAKGVVVTSIANPNQTPVYLPINRLQADTTYDWYLVTRKTSYRGSFEMPNSAETNEVKAKLEAVTKAESDPKVQLIYQAVILDDAEFYVARDKVLSQLRSMSAQ